MQRAKVYLCCALLALCGCRALRTAGRAMFVGGLVVAGALAHGDHDCGHQGHHHHHGHR